MGEAAVGSVEQDQKDFGSEAAVYLPECIQNRQDVFLLVRIRHWIKIAFPFHCGHLVLSCRVVSSHEAAW
jgi:hypothetical protein